MPLDTLTDLFQRAVAEHGPRVAMRYKAEDDGTWTPITYAQMGELVREASMGLQALGVDKGDRVAMLSKNRPEWAISDYAILHAAAITAPVYSTLTPEQAAFVIDDAEARVMFVSGELIELALDAAEHTSSLRTLVVYDEDAVVDAGGDAIEPVGSLKDILTLDALYGLGQERLGGDGDRGGADAYAERWQNLDGSDLATFIYTSGTTGKPKGVMLSHKNITSNIHSVRQIIDLSDGERYLSFLPLAHSFERTAGHFLPYSLGGEVWFAQSIDTIAEDLQDCKPHLFLAVPRLYEKMAERIQDKVAAAEGTQGRLARWAIRVGEQVFEADQAGSGAGIGLKLKHAIADKLVLSKIRKAAGFENVWYAGSGAAALDPAVAAFFGALGIPIYEGYGMTETSPVISTSRPGAYKLGAVGKPIPGVEVEIDTEHWDGQQGEGEILARGPNIMQGYYERPEATRETLTDDGWIHTGDVGYIDEDGYLHITDRMKELFKTAYGKYIAPSHIDALLKRSRWVEHSVIVGEKRQFVSAIIAPSFENLEAWAENQEGVDPDDREALIEAAREAGLFDEAIETANDELARWETVKRFRVVTDEWEPGEALTPTLKIKRRVVEDRYADLIEEMYGDT